MRQVALLSSLLGTLPLVECPGLAFKFFLPQELEPMLRAQEWFRPGRLCIFRIEWDDHALQELISQRLTYFSARGDRVYEQLSQLCEDDLAKSIDEELVTLAEGRPRWAIRLANMLLKTHCGQDDPPAQITQATWDIVKAKWPTLRADLLRDEQNLTDRDYKIGLRVLRDRVMDSRTPTKIAEFARLEARLLENLDTSTRSGDTVPLIVSRSQIVDELDRFALQVAGDSFTHLARIGEDQQDIRITRLIREGRRKGIPEISDLDVLRIDEDKGLVWLGDRDITSEINPQDYRVLVSLYRHQGAVCDKDLLVREAWPEVEADGVTDQTIAASIARLRRVLRQSSPDEGYIETVRGRGYRLHP
jgi:hypothetical protein